VLVSCHGVRHLHVSDTSLIRNVDTTQKTNNIIPYPKTIEKSQPISPKLEYTLKHEVAFELPIYVYPPTKSESVD